METLFIFLVACVVGGSAGIGAGVGFAYYQDKIRIKYPARSTQGRPPDAVASGEVSISGILFEPGQRDAIVEELADIALAYAGPAQLAAVQCVVNDPERLLKEHKALWRQVAIRIIADDAGMGEDEDEKGIP